jgi:hypothetical protein
MDAGMISRVPALILAHCIPETIDSVPEQSDVRSRYPGMTTLQGSEPVCIIESYRDGRRIHQLRATPAARTPGRLARVSPDDYLVSMNAHGTSTRSPLTRTRAGGK